MPATDCHVHLFDPARFPYAPHRAYTPGAASAAQLNAMHETIGITRVVVVQPSVYGADNACLLDAIAQLGHRRARGVAVVDLLTITDAELERLHAGGVRGLRLNLHVNGHFGEHEIAQQLAAVKRLRALPKWHLQIFANLNVHAQFLNTYQSLQLPVVLDHFAGGVGDDSRSEAQLQMILDAMKTDAIFVKLSAAYRLPQGADAGTLAQQFYNANPRQVLWGSDWPHTGGAVASARSTQKIEPFREIDNVAALHGILRALGSDAAKQQLLVDNPTALYSF